MQHFLWNCVCVILHLEHQCVSVSLIELNPILICLLIRKPLTFVCVVCVGRHPLITAVLPARVPRGREHQDLHLGPDHAGRRQHRHQEPLRPVRPRPPRPQGQEGAQGVHPRGHGLAQRREVWRRGFPRQKLQVGESVLPLFNSNANPVPGS